VPLAQAVEWRTLAPCDTANPKPDDTTPEFELEKREPQLLSLEFDIYDEFSNMCKMQDRPELSVSACFANFILCFCARVHRSEVRM